MVPPKDGFAHLQVAFQAQLQYTLVFDSLIKIILDCH
jgi:hypothetical protein